MWKHTNFSWAPLVAMHEKQSMHDLTYIHVNTQQFLFPSIFCFKNCSRKLCGEQAEKEQVRKSKARGKDEMQPNKRGGTTGATWDNEFLRCAMRRRCGDWKGERRTFNWWWRRGILETGTAREKHMHCVSRLYRLLATWAERRQWALSWRVCVLGTHQPTP